MDNKLKKELDKIKIGQNEYFKNQFYNIYKLNKISKWMVEYYFLCKNDEKNIKNDKINQYKLKIKALLLENQLLRQSLMITKKKSFLSLSNNKNIENNNKIKQKIISLTLKEKINKISKEYKENKENKQKKQKIYHQIINNDDNINYEQFENLYKPLFDSPFYKKSKLSEIWKKYFANYLLFSKQKNILPKQFESKLKIINQIGSNHENILTKCQSIKQFQNEYKQRYGDHYKNIIINEENYDHSKNIFFDNRNLFKKFAKNNNNNYYESYCYDSYDDFEYNSDCSILSNLSNYSYINHESFKPQINHKNDDKFELENLIKSLSLETSSKISPIYTKIQWKENKFLNKTTNIPLLRDYPLKSDPKSNTQKPVFLKRNKQRVKNINIVKQEQQQQQQQEQQDEYDVDVDDNIPILGMYSKNINVMPGISLPSHQLLQQQQQQHKKQQEILQLQYKVTKEETKLNESMRKITSEILENLNNEFFSKDLNLFENGNKIHNILNKINDNHNLNEIKLFKNINNFNKELYDNTNWNTANNVIQKNLYFKENTEIKQLFFQSYHDSISKWIKCTVSNKAMNGTESIYAPKLLTYLKRQRQIIYRNMNNDKLQAPFDDDDNSNNSKNSNNTKNSKKLLNYEQELRVKDYI